MAEIVGMVTSLVGPAIELGKCVTAPIKRQFSYLFCFNSNIKTLRDEAKKLEEVRDGLQRRVDEAENNARLIIPGVKAWLTRANTEIEVNLIEIENEIRRVQGDFWASKSRFSLSKKARKTSEAMKELREDCKFDHISDPIPPPAKVSIPLGSTYESQSRKQIEGDIMEALRDKKVNMLGICGMGGVGKTMMAKRITNRVKEEQLFDEVVMSVLSQQVDVLKIQREIAESLGLTLEVESLSARAHHLRARLRGKKRILIVLDDIWKTLKLEDLGLTPCESGVEGYCTILLTSRDKDVLNAMEAQKVFAIQTLSEEEAWFLFREKVGNCVDNLNLLSIADQVAKECRGLPIALITVALALKDEKDKSIWADALQQLKDSNPIDMPDVLEGVYNPLKLSYDSLDRQHAKPLFLLCCLFPEDSDISLNYLTWYCMGLRIFKGKGELEQVRNRVLALVKTLKNPSLLLDGHGKHDVRMHDVVRDVAIYVASKERFIDLNLQKMNWSGEQYSYSDCRWISLFPKRESELPNFARLNFPSLGLFMMHCSGGKYFEFKDMFEGMKGLNVFSLGSMYLESLPETIQLLKNLRTLHLQKCTLASISVVGELLSLEILSFKRCDIRELPVEIGRLNRLKLLEFSHCSSLRTIVPGVMSNLFALEELKIINSFRGWELAKVSREGNRNLSLNELQSLSNLTCLKIEVKDYNLAAEEICLSSKIVRYHIFINLADSVPASRFLITIYEKKMGLKLPREIALGNWVKILLKDTECLILEGDGSNSLDLSQAHNIKTLDISSCSTMKTLVSTTTTIYWRRLGVFPVLEYMLLSRLPNLEEICQGPIPEGSNSFKSLREFRVSFLPVLKTLWEWESPSQNTTSTILPANLSLLDILGCGKLLNLFPLTMAKGLLQLESLTVFDCEMMEELFSNKESGIKGHITFPKLKKLKLRDLPNLTTFCQGIESISFPSLISMTIDGCRKLTSIFSTKNYKNSGDRGCMFHSQKVSFPILESLELSHVPDLEEICDGPTAEGFNLFKDLSILTLVSFPALKYLWKNPNVKNNINTEEFLCDNKWDGVLQLGYLHIEDCEMMEKVLLNEEEEYDDKYHLAFPKLKTLRLCDLPNLTTFSQGIETIEFPLLELMAIRECPKLISIVSPVGTDGHDDDTCHLFCCPKVTFDRLNWLIIEGYTSNVCNLWCHQIPDGFFSGLQGLEIIECDSIRNLFSSAVARNLVNLEYLEIGICKEMVKVIEDEEEIIRKPNCPLLSLIFPRLRRVELDGLPKLESLCEWRCELELSALEYVSIASSPLMKTFTIGSLRTPKLNHVYLDEHLYKEHLEDLNSVLQLHGQCAAVNEKSECTSAEGEDEESEIEENAEDNC